MRAFHVNRPADQPVGGGVVPLVHVAQEVGRQAPSHAVKLSPPSGGAPGPRWLPAGPDAGSSDRSRTAPGTPARRARLPATGRGPSSLAGAADRNRWPRLRPGGRSRTVRKRKDSGRSVIRPASVTNRTGWATFLTSVGLGGGRSKRQHLIRIRWACGGWCSPLLVQALRQPVDAVVNAHEIVVDPEARVHEGAERRRQLVGHDGEEPGTGSNLHVPVRPGEAQVLVAADLVHALSEDVEQQGDPVLPSRRPGQGDLGCARD